MVNCPSMVDSRKKRKERGVPLHSEIIVRKRWFVIRWFEYSTFGLPCFYAILFQNEPPSSLYKDLLCKIGIGGPSSF